jgi:RNA-binding protein YlmH
VSQISEGKVFLSGRQMTENAKSLKSGDVISVRGKGKFIFDGEGGNTKKDKLYIKIKRYI